MFHFREYAQVASCQGSVSAATACSRLRSCGTRFAFFISDRGESVFVGEKRGLMLSYKAIHGVFSGALVRARALSLPPQHLPQDHNSEIGNRNPFGSGIDVCGVTPWAMSFGWPGHEDCSSNPQTREQLKLPPDPLPEPSNIKRAVTGTGVAALILAVGILNQQIALTAISTLDRVGRSAAIQGALAKPLGQLFASIFQ